MTTTMTSPTHPDTPPPVAENIPAALRELAQWVNWRWTLKDAAANRWTKPPINPHTGGLASTAASSTWGAFAEAMTRAESDPSLAGIGFVLSSNDEYSLVDLDGCVDDADTLKPEALAIVRALGSYAELSATGTGVHVLARGTLPGSGMTQHRVACSDGTTFGIEMYCTGRYATMTGHRIDGTPATIENAQEALTALYQRYIGESAQRRESGHSVDAASAQPRYSGTRSPVLTDDEVIRLATNAKNGAKFERLMAGDVDAHGGDDRTHSAADLALLTEITFWTQDEAQVERIFQRSGLFRPDRWKAGYRRLTLAKALDRTDVYSGPGTRDPGNGHRRDVDVSTLRGATPAGDANIVDNVHDVDPRAARVADLQLQVAALRAECDQLRAENRDLRRAEHQRAQLLRNPKMADGPKLMLLAIAPELASVRSGAGAPVDGSHDPRRVGNAVHVNLAAMGERIGRSGQTAGDHISKLCDAGVIRKHYRPKTSRDAETGRLLQGSYGKELLIEPVFAGVDALFEAGATAETPGRATQGGKREPRPCPDHPDSRLIRVRTDRYVCEDCGQVTDEQTVRTVITPNSQVDVSGEPLPLVDVSTLVRQVDVSGPPAPPAELNSQVDCSGRTQGLCTECHGLLPTLAERDAGRHSYPCLAPPDLLRMRHTQYATAAGGD